MNRLDRLIAALSPETGLRRVRARARLAALGHAQAMFEGASMSRRTAGWRRVSTDANAEVMGGALGRLRDGARDMVRNNPYAKRGVAVIADYTVGGGIIPQFTGATDVASELLERLAVDHLDSVAVDADGQHDLYGLQWLAMRTVAEAGEVLVRRRRRLSSDGLPLPFQLQVLEPDFIDTARDADLGGGRRIVQGVEFNAIGRRVAYWLFDRHPGTVASYRIPQSHRVPAEDIAHVFRTDRPGQVRGVTWLHAVMLRMNDFADFEDARLLREKVAAAYAGFVEDADLEEGLRAPAPGTTVSGDGQVLEELEPGIIEHLPPGKRITWSDPPTVDGYSDAAKTHLRAISVGLDVPADLLTGDLSDVNYSSLRSGRLSFKLAVGIWQHRIMIGKFCRPVERWFAEAAGVAAGVGGPVSATWTPPGFQLQDPSKEVPAECDEIRAGLCTPSEAVRRRGRDPKRHFEEFRRDLAMLDDLGIVLDSDPRRVSRAGLAQVRLPDQDYPDPTE